MVKLKKHFLNIELIKNSVLVVLFFTTMLLLYFFWGSPISNGFKISNLIGADQLEIPAFEEVTIPGRIIVHTGDGSYADESNSDFWEIYMEGLKNLSKEDVISVEEITEEQFEKIMDFKSIFFRFYYDLPYEVLTKRYKLAEFSGVEQLGDISLFAFSTGSPESSFVYNSNKNKYYRIVLSEPFEVFNKRLTKTEAGWDTRFRRIGELVGTENRTVIPLYKNSTASLISFNPEYSNLESEEVKEFAQSFFGESLDFVRQIQDSKGSKIYMYGYGEKVLTISPAGRVEYKDKETPQGSQQSYIEALDSAMKFVAVHGGWEFSDGIEMTPYVVYAKQIEHEKQKGYRIIFGMKFDNKSIYLENSYSIMVDVVHEQVVQYVRNIIEIDEAEVEKQDKGTLKEAYSAINMIAQNYKYIADILSENNIDLSLYKEEELFDAISDKIVYVKSGYLKPQKESGNGNMLIPAWIVNIGDILIFFNLYNASPLGYTNLIG